MLFFAVMLESVLFFVDTIGFFASDVAGSGIFTLISFRTYVGAHSLVRVRVYGEAYICIPFTGNFTLRGNTQILLN
jgi:hypothetical protein